MGVLDWKSGRMRETQVQGWVAKVYETPGGSEHGEGRMGKEDRARGHRGGKGEKGGRLKVGCTRLYGGHRGLKNKATVLKPGSQLRREECCIQRTQ